MRNKDVLDESYRKAGKLDANRFMCKLSLSDMKRIVQKGLLPYNQEDREIALELYKLNVYGLSINFYLIEIGLIRVYLLFLGKGSFFKSHKDTPRSENMFGSLAIILPIQHEGGNLLLKHSSSDFHFDSASLLSSHLFEHGTQSFAYVAFYSDVEHEVAEVTSGHRVTITYNLYFQDADFDTSPVERPSKRQRNDIDPPSPVPLQTPLVTYENTPFHALLAQYIADPEFLPEGGLLGFGLAHSYPIPSVNSDVHLRQVDYPKLYSTLKGEDAVMIETLSALGLKHYLRIIYQDDDITLMARRPIERALLDSGAETFMDYYVISADENTKILWHDENDDLPWDVRKLNREVAVSWIRPPTQSGTRKEEPYAAYGNEPTLGYFYGDFVLVVRIGKWGDRTSQEAI